MGFVEAYLQEKGLNYKEVNGQFNLETSPVSKEVKRNHFYINVDSGMRDDKKEGSKGNFNQFRALLGDGPIDDIPIEHTAHKERVYRKPDKNKLVQYSGALWGLSPSILDYLHNRGLSDETIKHFSLGVDGQDIIIPVFDYQGELLTIRKRMQPLNLEYDGPRYTSESGCESGLFNSPVLAKKLSTIYITEGEFDAMVLWQQGITNVVATTLGAKGFPQKRVGLLDGVKRINIVYDNDDAGKEGAIELADKLGKDRCYVVHLPEITGEKKVDLTDYFTKHGGTKESFLGLVEKASPSLHDPIKHISEFNEELRARLLGGDYTGISTGYESLDNVIGGYRNGRVIVVSGLTSTGKTTFSQNLTLSLAHREKRVLFISMEMPPIDICKKFLMLYKKLKGTDLTEVSETSSIMSEIDAGLQGFSDGLPIYLYEGTGEVTIQTVTEVCNLAKSKRDIDLIVVDHLHYFGKNSGNRAAEVASIMRSIKGIAMALDLPVVLLAHLNRAGRNQQRRGLYIPTLADLKDAGAIEQDADQVVFVCRDTENEDLNEKRKTVIKIAKNRDGATGHVSFDFDLDTGIFSPVTGVDYIQGVPQTKQKEYDTETDVLNF